MPRALLVTALLLLAASARAQTVRFVDSGGADVGDCSDAGSPCETITYALSRSAPGDAIEIADGEYTESFEIDKDIALLGESEVGTLIQADATPGTATERVITIDGTHEVEISELTIRHGLASGDFPKSAGGGIYVNGATLTVSNVTFLANEAGASGGGVFIGNSSPSFTNVTFSANVAALGAGIYNGEDNFPTLLNVTFSENTASLNGGGMFNDGNSSPALESVAFIDNEAGHQGGGMFNDICTAGCAPTLTNVTFSGNVAGQSGGGMLNSTLNFPVIEKVIFHENAAQFGGGMLNGNSSPTLTNVTFSSNSADFGGGMYNENSSPTLANVAFIGNEAVGAGGGMRNGSSTPNLVLGSFEFTNVTFGENSAGNVGGAMSNTGFGIWTFVNTIVWGNTAGNGGNEIFNGPDAAVRLDYSLYSDGPGDIVVGGGFDVESSLTEDPLFVDAESGNLRLMDGSPAIDAGDPVTDPALFLVDENGVPVDLDGDPRFVPDEAAIDIGAYEVSTSTISIADRPEKELNNGLHLMRFTLTMSNASDEPVTVDYATQDGTAIAGVDYFAASGTVTFDPGEVSAGIFVAIIPNTEIDGNRNFFVNLSNPGGATIEDATAVGTIFDDDSLAPNLSLSNAGFE